MCIRDRLRVLSSVYEPTEGFAKINGSIGSLIDISLGIDLEATGLENKMCIRDRSYADPRYTYETNVMGTVNLLECIRLHPSASSVLNITTDKVYENKEWEWGYREIEALNGFDPYSNSKSCSDIATQSYIKSFFSRETSPAISIARAGNVIGGGDFSKDRIIPDSVEACSKNKVIHVRNPYSIRPYQHVLEPLSAYLWIIFRQASDPVSYTHLDVYKRQIQA